MTTFGNVTPSSNSTTDATDATVHKNKCAIIPALLSSRPKPGSTGLQVRRPKTKEIVTILGDPTPIIPCLISKVKQDWGKFEKEVFHPIAPTMQEPLAGVFHLIQFHLAVNSDGIFFVWPQKLPSLDGNTNSWAESATTVVAAGGRGWIGVMSDMESGCYRVRPSDSSEAIPTQYPSLDAEFNRALGGNIITDEHHPILKTSRYAKALKVSVDKGGWQ